MVDGVVSLVVPYDAEDDELVVEINEDDVSLTMVSLDAVDIDTHLCFHVSCI